MKQTFTRLRRGALLLFSILIQQALMAQTTYTQGFEDNGNWGGTLPLTGYQTDRTYAEPGQPVVFACSNGALRETQAVTNGANSTYNPSTYAWRIQNGGGTGSWTATVGAGGVGTYSFWVRPWNTSALSYEVEYSTNNGGTWTPVQTINQAFFSNTVQWLQISGTINTGNGPGAADDIIIRVRRVSGERLMIDQFEMTDYNTSTNTITAGAVSGAPFNLATCAATATGTVACRYTGFFCR